MSLNAISAKAPTRAVAVTYAPSEAPKGEEVADRVAPRQPRLSAVANPTLVLAAPGATPPPDARFPRNVCMNGRCAPEANRIWSAFEAAGQVDLKALPRVFSGGVHWIMPQYDQNDTHHGGVLLDPQVDGSIQFKGRFWFFSPSDPYAQTTVDQARAWGPGYTMQRKADYLYVNCNPHVGEPNGGSPMEYWLRQDPTTRNVYIVGFWGDGRYGLGELRGH